MAVIAWTASLGAAGADARIAVKVPMVCSRGPDTQYFNALVTAPATAAAGSVYTIRIDSVPSAKISGTGLNYLHEMLTDYFLPRGASFVVGSARIVPDTGTENVRAGARVWNEGGFVRIYLPAHVDSGSSYTPPSLEFQVKATASAGTSLPLQFVQHRLTANVFLLGNLHVVCNPNPTPYTIATTRVLAPATPVD
jgi:hypothetical protein